MAKIKETATKKAVATPAKKAAPAPAAAPAKKASPLVADKNGDFPFILYSVRAKTWVDMAKKPKPTLAPTGRGAYMCKAHDTEGNTISMIVSTTVANNWINRKLAEEA